MSETKRMTFEITLDVPSKLTRLHVIREIKTLIEEQRPWLPNVPLWVVKIREKEKPDG